MDHLLPTLVVLSCAGFGLATLSIDISPSYTVVKPGSSTDVRCIVNSTQIFTTTYKWFITGTNSDDQEISASDKYELFNNGTLTINDFSKQDQGEYYCTASNSLGSVKSLKAQIKIASIGTILSTTHQIIYFRENEYLELPCNVPNSVPDADVSWYKGQGSSASIITPNSRMGITQNHTLIFSYCLDDDNGPWECRIKNKLIGGQPQISDSYLLSESGSPLATVQNSQILYGPVDQTIITGMSFELQCIAVGRPYPIYTWLKNGITIQQSDRITFSQNSRVLSISNAELADGGSYSCRVSQISLTHSSTSNSASIVVKGPPSILSPTIGSPVSQSQYASLTVNFSCTATGSDLEAIAWTWLVNAVKVEESNNIQIETSVVNSNVSQSLLKIHSLDTDHGGVWQCVASNEETGSDQATQILTVNTTVPIILEQPEDKLAFVGENISLSFNCMAYPYPQFTWQEDGEAISLQSKHSIDDSSPFSGSLTIFLVEESDSGTYRCTCKNGQGTKTSSAALVKIINEPVPLIKPQDTIVYLGHSVLLNCMIEDYSSVAITYSWQRDFNTLSDSDMIETYSNGSLHISSFATEHIGYYECFVSLKSESNSAEILFHSIGGAFLTEDPPTRPSSPINLNVGSVGSRSASLSWDEPLHKGGLQILGYTVEVRNLGRHDCTTIGEDFSMTTNSSEMTQLMVSLKPYSRYTLTVYAFNSKGNSNSSTETNVFWTREEEPSMAPRVTSFEQGSNVGDLIVEWEHPPCQERNGQLVNYTIKLVTVSTNEEKIIVTPTNSTVFTIRELRPLQEYTVHVSASTGVGPGPFSLPLSTETTLASVPDVPRNLMIDSISAKSVNLSWDPPKPRENEPINELTMVMYYIVQYNDTEITELMETDYTAFNLSAGTTLQFIIMGVNSFGRGESAMLTVSLPTEMPPLVSESPSTTPTIGSVNETDGIAFYQEAWFPAFAGGIGGGILLAIVCICVLICAISYCCRKNDKHNRSFSSNHTATSMNSFSYPTRKATILDKMMQVEALESPVPPAEDDDGDDNSEDAINDNGNLPVDMNPFTLSQQSSSSTLQSKYKYRSPMEQEEYQRLSDFRNTLTRSENSTADRQMTRTTSGSHNGSRKKPSTFKSATSTSSTAKLVSLKREPSPTDTVSSFEYQSQNQLISQMMMMRSNRIPSYTTSTTTDGYDTSSEDDSVFHHVVTTSGSNRHRQHRRVPVKRNSSFKVEYDSKNLPDLALMTAIPQPGGNSQQQFPYMPNAIPSQTPPVPVDPMDRATPPPPASSHISTVQPTLVVPNGNGNVPQRLNRVPKSRFAGSGGQRTRMSQQPHNIPRHMLNNGMNTTINEHATFV